MTECARCVELEAHLRAVEAAHQQEMEQMKAQCEQPAGERFLLNAYGRRCWEAGYAAAEARLSALQAAQEACLRAIIIDLRRNFGIQPEYKQHMMDGILDRLKQLLLPAAVGVPSPPQGGETKDDQSRGGPLTAHADGQDPPRISHRVAVTDATRTEEEPDTHLLAWAVTNCHMLARRALARSVSTYDREKWEHVLRICEKAGARSRGVLRAAVPTEITDGSV